jgi:hypothetical protein
MFPQKENIFFRILNEDISTAGRLASLTTWSQIKDLLANILFDQLRSPAMPSIRFRAEVASPHPLFMDLV